MIGKCAASEWLEYPENRPEIGKEYIFEMQIFSYGYGYSSNFKRRSVQICDSLKYHELEDEYRKILRFAEIKL